MKSFKYVIKDKQGIHARPAGLVVAEAKKYGSNVTLTCRGKTVDLKRIFALMGLCIKCGEEVEVAADGADEANAIAAIQKLFETNL